MANYTIPLTLHGIIARMRLLYHWGRESEGSKARFCPGRPILPLG